MAASTTLADGTVVRYHAPPAFTECADPVCNLRHVSTVELFADLLAADDVHGATS